MRARRRRRSSCPSARQRAAITSEAGVMSNPVSRGTPSSTPPRPMTTWRSARSFMSMTRRQVTRRASMSSALPWWMWLSSIAASRLCADPIAWKSPVKCRLMSCSGTTRAWPPPVAPPFCPKVGPSDGSRSVRHTRWPRRARPCTSPIDVVVLPSPASVGVMADTRMRRPAGRPDLKGVERDLGLVGAVRDDLSGRQVQSRLATSRMGRADRVRAMAGPPEMAPGGTAC